jgi:hypothetical protein
VSRLPDGLRSYMAGPAGVAEIEMLGLDRSGATRLSDLPIDLQQVPSWAQYLAPAGFRGGLAAGLCTPDGRYLGMLGLNTDSVAHPTVAARPATLCRCPGCPLIPCSPWVRTCSWWRRSG